MTDDKFYEELSNLINGAFDDVYGRKLPTPKTRKPIMQTETIKPDPNRDHFPNLYESIEDYTAQTGKRFRMTKEQKSRNLTREEAFSEMYLGGTN
tara:strand:- start:7845 stop:8129 length:285 start_codon:yes stop_codon:yes gene_type:complete